MFMQTASGKSFHPTKPTSDVIDIGDIAHALSNMCRFAGHTKHFYSVAQHSVIVANIVRDHGGSLKEQFHGLLHDATEAYITDMPTPVKRLIPDFKALEDKIYVCVADKFGLDPVLPEIVHTADGIALATEAESLMINSHLWNLPHEAEDYDISYMPPIKARRFFLKKYAELSKLLTLPTVVVKQ